MSKRLADAERLAGRLSAEFDQLQRKHERSLERKAYVGRPPSSFRRWGKCAEDIDAWDNGNVDVWRGLPGKLSGANAEAVSSPLLQITGHAPGMDLQETQRVLISQVAGYPPDVYQLEPLECSAATTTTTSTTTTSTTTTSTTTTSTSTTSTSTTSTTSTSTTSTTSTSTTSTTTTSTSTTSTTTTTSDHVTVDCCANSIPRTLHFSISAGGMGQCSCFDGVSGTLTFTSGGDGVDTDGTWQGTFTANSCESGVTGTIELDCISGVNAGKFDGVWSLAVSYKGSTYNCGGTVTPGTTCSPFTASSTFSCSAGPCKGSSFDLNITE